MLILKSLDPHLIHNFLKSHTIKIICIFRGKRDDGDSDEDTGRGRKERKGRKRKDGKNRNPDSDDGLSAKQRRKVVSKAMISSSEGSDSEGAKKLRIHE